MPTLGTFPVPPEYDWDFMAFRRYRRKAMGKDLCVLGEDLPLPWILPQSLYVEVA